VIKIADLSSRISLDTTDKSQVHDSINQYVSPDNLVKGEFHKNLTSKDPNHNVPSELSASEKTVTKNTEPLKVGGELASVTKQILVIDDDLDSAIAIRTCLESYPKKNARGSGFQTMEVTMYSNPVTALVEFKPYYYDLVLVDINMPTVNGYELVEKITRLDLNIKVCFMSSGELNYEAIREINHPTKSFGCFISKPATAEYLVNRVAQELY
jgi:CheY-like chemotaxis protein